MFPFTSKTNISQENATYDSCNVRVGSGPDAKAEEVDIKFSIHLHNKCFTGKYRLKFSNMRLGSGSNAKAEAVDINVSIHLQKKCLTEKYHI